MQRPLGTVFAICVGIILGAVVVSVPAQALIDSSRQQLSTIVRGVPQTPNNISLVGRVERVDLEAKTILVRIMDPRIEGGTSVLSILIGPDVTIRKSAGVYQKDILTQRALSLASIADIKKGLRVDVTLSRLEGPLRAYYVLLYES
jgi:CBS-domain-containing membrane protein